MSIGAGGEILFTAGCDGVDAIARYSETPVATKDWLHLAGTHSQGMIRLYVNGQLESEVVCVTPGWPDDLPFNVGGFFRGIVPSAAMRQIRVWDRALSDAELIAVAESQLTGDEENLAGYWPLDDGGGDIARDLGPHGLNLQLGELENFRNAGEPRFVHTDIFDDQMQSGAFYPLVSINEFSYPVEGSALLGAVLMDIDHDGDPDGLFMGSGDPGPECTTPVVPFVAFRNDGNGKFVEDTATLLVGPVEGTEGVMHPVVADFTGDGLDDLFIVDFGWDTPGCKGAQIRLLVGTQSGQLRDETAARLPSTPLLVGFGATEGDIDNDGDLDVFVYGQPKLDQELAPAVFEDLLLINDGEGNFSVDTTRFPDWLDVSFKPLCSGFSNDPEASHACGQLALMGKLIDTDLDGDLDMVLLISRSGPGPTDPTETPLEKIPQIQVLRVFLNDGSGNFSEGPRLPVREDRATSGQREIFPGDFNSDGWPDFIYTIEGRHVRRQREWDKRAPELRDTWVRC